MENKLHIRLIERNDMSDNPELRASKAVAERRKHASESYYEAFKLLKASGLKAGNRNGS